MFHNNHSPPPPYISTGTSLRGCPCTYNTHAPLGLLAYFAAMATLKTIISLKTRWYCANLQRLPFPWIISHKVIYMEDRYCLYIGINVKVRFSTHPRPQHPYQRLPFPSIISHKVSYMRGQMLFIHRHKS